MADLSQTEATIPNGEEIVERFGGIRPMAAKLEVPVTTVQGWKKRDAIPLSRRDEIITAASQHNVNLKGLLAESVANQNARGTSGIEEDPALRPITHAPASASRPSAQTQYSSDMAMLKSVRNSARTTSIMTSISLIILVGAAGALLFGGTVNRQNNQIASLEHRVSDIEGQAPTASGIPASLDATISNLQGQVQAITTAIGGSAQDLAASGTNLLQRLSALEQQVAANPGGQNLQGALEQMQNMVALPQGVATWQSAIEELRNVVNGLQGRVDGLDGALAQAKTQNDALAVTLENVTGRDLSAAAMLLALTQVRQSVDRQTPFTEDLALLRQVAANISPEMAASVDRMAPYAENGVLSSAGLKKELQGLSNDILTAKLKGEDVSFKDRLMARLQGLFTLKKDGVPVTGGEERALIARASSQLDNNDVAGAMTTLQGLQGPAAEAVAPWQQQAAATLAMQQIDTQLVSALMNKIRGLTAGAGAGGVTVNAGPIDLSTPAPQQEAPSAIVIPTQPDAGQQPVQPPIIIQQ